jgi:cytochrome c553
MKKIMFVLLVVAFAGTMALAQITAGNLNYVPTVDVQGAHENGGRGCAGCHAPHSGGRGSGGNIISGSAAFTAAGVQEGDSGLWGTDTNPIETGYATITFDGSYPVTLAGLSWSSGSLYTGVATCLSCHDGNVSKGAMMSGQAYEQSFGLLNFATNVGSNHQAAPVNLYGSNPIPTLLGNDGGVAGDYSNDHPVGPKANLGAVASAALTNGLVVTVAANKATIAITAGTSYAQFVSNYGYPAIASLAVTSGDTNSNDLYVVCTTCHNQHVQNVYSTLGYGAQKIAGGTVSAAATIFYVNGPYNPGAPYDPTHVPSTNRFCLQCHFNHSSEYFGATTVGTAF